MKITNDPTGGSHVIIDVNTAVIPQSLDAAIVSLEGGTQLLAVAIEGTRTGAGDESVDEVYLVDAHMAARLCGLIITTVAGLGHAAFKEAFYAQIDADLTHVRRAAE